MEEQVVIVVVENCVVVDRVGLLLLLVNTPDPSPILAPPSRVSPAPAPTEANIPPPVPEDPTVVEPTATACKETEALAVT